MSAANADRNTVKSIGAVRAYPVAVAAKIYAGTMVCRNSSGYAIAGADAAGNVILGVAEEQADNSAGQNGDILVRCQRKGAYQFASSGLAITDQDCDLYLADDQTVQKTPTNVYVGKLVKYISATVAEIEFESAFEEEPAEGEDYVAYPVAATTTIVDATMVCLNSSGYLIPATDTDGLKFVGVAVEGKDNSGGADGDLSCLVSRSGIKALAATGLAITDAGKPCWVSDASTVTLTPGKVFAGVLAYYASATAAKVAIDVAVSDPKGLSRGRTFIIPFSKGGDVGASQVVLAGLEIPVASKLLRGFATLGTAPGSEKTTTITITDGSNPQAFTITGTSTSGEDKAIDQVYAANTDLSITVTDDGDAAADLNGVLIFQEL